MRHGVAGESNADEQEIKLAWLSASIDSRMLR